VINVGPGLKLLTLGDGDGGVWDNSGQFNVQLFGVESVAALPEPSTLLLLGSGLLAFLAVRPKLGTA
jgi:PEP-CTERM motif